MAVLNLQIMCLTLGALWSCGHCSELIDHTKAMDVLLKNPSLHLTKGLEVERQFVSFMKKHKRVYKSGDEVCQRFKYFNAHMKEAAHIQKTDRGTAKFGATKFADLSDEEFKAFTGLRMDLPALSNNTKSQYEKASKKKSGAVGQNTPPAAYDWRERGFVTPVKDQKMCGSCWAFSTIGAVESHHAIKTNQLVDLSEQQLVDCDGNDGGCNGGFMFRAFEYIIDAGGVVPSANYSYIADQNEENNRHCNISAADSNSLVKVVRYEEIPQDEDKMLSYLYENGPISVAINDITIRFLLEGIVDSGELECNPCQVDHAVLIVGYGEEVNRQGETIPFWIIKNSWGPHWGEKGYFRFRRGKNVCGVAMLASAPVTL